ncbi:uncharacterized protein CBL_07339 [Carabus blaptoides fortunei]
MAYQLGSDITFGANAQPVKLPETSSVPAGDVEAVLIGWGRNTTGGPVQDILKKISYTKFSDAHCKGTEPEYNPNYHVCAGTPGGGKGQCNSNQLTVLDSEEDLEKVIPSLDAPDLSNTRRYYDRSWYFNDKRRKLCSL